MNTKIVSGDDWQALYIDNTLRTQGHSITVRDVLHALDIQYDELSVDCEWLHEEGYLPNQFDEIPQDLLKKY